MSAPGSSYQRSSLDKIDDFDKEKEFEKEKEIAECEEKADTQQEGGVVKTGEVEKMKKQLEESQNESRGRFRVPIGGVKIPGFLRSRSRDKPKEGDGTAEEGDDLLESSTQKPSDQSGFRATLARQIGNLAAMTKREPPAEGEEPKPTLLNRIKLPAAVSSLPKRFSRGGKKDAEHGAELASVETLEDGKPASPDDGMESVKLDGDDSKDAEKAGLAGDSAKQPIYLQWKNRLMQLSKHEKIIIGVVLLILFLLIIIIAATSGGVGPMATAPPVVDGKVITTTQCGQVEGLKVKDAYVFRGIPYAAPPEKERRWRPAQPLNNLDLCWSQPLYLAHNASRQCWQEISHDKVDGYENCLTLDIYTPEVRYINPVPVVVLIDTKSLIGGPPGVLNPTPEIVHTKEVVFVRPNFRLGVLGFLAASPLSKKVYPPSSGNYGLSDIIVALKWVQTNIQHFGGDNKLVTLVGHRAGATLVTALTASPAAKGLFKHAWASSGSAMFPGEVLQMSEKEGAAYVDDVCPDNGTDEQKKLECLLTKSAETLLESVSDDWRPRVMDLPKIDETPNHQWLVQDGKILQTHIWSDSAERHAKLVVGTTSESEASSELWRRVEEAGGKDAIEKYIRNSAAGNESVMAEISKRYKYNWEDLARMVSDIRTVCPLLAMSRAQVNVTFYVSLIPRNHTDLGSIADVEMDMASVMGHYKPDTKSQQNYVKSMQDLFYTYVETGEVPPYRTSSPHPVIVVDERASWKDDYPNCNFWIQQDFVPKYARRD